MPQDDGPRFCLRCDAEIPARRVQALPGTSLCIECSQETGGEFTYIAVPQNLGKPGSLKRNYASISIHRRRRVLPPRTG